MLRFNKPNLFFSTDKAHPVSRRLRFIAGLLLVLLALASLRAAPGDRLNSPNYRDLAWACYNQGDYPNAIANLTQAIRQHPRDAWAWNGLALARENLGDLPGALADFGMAAKIKPDDAGVYVNCGLLLQYDTNKLGIAIADYTEAIRLEPANASFFVIRARAYREQMNFDPALSDYCAALQLQPTNAGLYFARGNLQMEMTNDDAALHDYTEAIRLDPTNTWYLECRGELHASLTNFDAAIGDYTQCLQLQPTNAAYCCRRAGLEEASEWTAARLGHPTKARELRYQALKDLRQAAALDSARLSALGAFEYRHGLYADAITNYTKHLQWHPDDELAWISREFRAYACERAANNDAQRGDLKNKNAALEQALADWNQLAASATNLETGSGFLCQRGNFFARNNQFAQALADYQRAVELAPASESSGWLALFLATCPDQKFRNGGQALVYARKAYEPNPSPDDIVLAGLAAAYAETGDFEQAVQFQQMALQAMDARQDQLETGGVGYLGCPDSFHSEMADRLLLYEQSRPCHKIMGLME